MKISSMLRRGTWLLLCALVIPGLFSSGCSKPAADPEVLAVFDGGEIRVADLDRAIRALPPAERAAQLASREQLERIVRGLAFKQIMKRTIEAEMSRSDHFRDLIEEDVRRGVVVSMYLQSHDLLKNLTEEEILSWAEKHPELGRQETRRLVYTFFLASGPNRSISACTRQAEAIRDRVLSGESFPKLAEKYSQSETRHRQGMLGWISPGQLPEGLDEIVSGMKEGELSDVITTAHGVHLFWVRSLIPGHTLSDRELLALAGPILRDQQVDRVLDDALRELGVPMPDIPNKEELRDLLRDPEKEVLRVGSWALSGADLRFLLRRKEIHPVGGIPQFLQRMAGMEAIRQAVIKQGVFSSDEIEKAVRGPLGAEMLQYEVNRRMRDWLAADTKRLRDLFENEGARFQDPPLYEVLEVVIPFGEDPVGRMRELESFCANPENGVENLEILSHRLGGDVRKIPEAPMAVIQPGHPGIIGILKIRPGSLTPPHRTERDFVIYGLLGEKAPRAMSFEEARPSIVEMMLEEKEEKLRKEFSADVLKIAGFQVFDQRLEPTYFADSLTPASPVR